MIQTTPGLKNTLARITGIILLAAGIIACLIFITTRSSRQNNGFVRWFPHYTLTKQHSIGKADDVVAISGATRSRIFFQTANPARLFSTDGNLNHGQYIVLNLPENDLIRSGFECIADSPLVYLFATNWPGVFTTHFTTGNVAGYRFPTALFTRSVALSPLSIALRGFDTSVRSADQVFMKGNPATGSLIREKNISERTGDMGISSDGILHYDTLHHLLIYIYFYANRILALDTNLNLVYQSHTIDTTSTTRTKAAGIPGENAVTYTNTGPSRFINMESCVSGGLLYNYSLLQADNEKREDFEVNSVIDIYRLKDGTYTGSFYIPDFKREKIQRFRVFGERVVILYSSHICVYALQ